jgi:hemolysin III
MSPAVKPAVSRADELAADRLVHVIGLTFGIVGATVLCAVAADAAHRLTFDTSLFYSLCLVAMLVCSAAYNLALGSPRRTLLRRLDHAAIFLLIAGTYTPFTVCRLHGPWSIGMTAAVWVGAIAGAATKLLAPARSTAFSTAAYLGLGWIVLVGLRPMLEATDPLTMLLIGAGGAIYSVGAGVHLWRALRFHNAIWHAMVVIAASCHYAAILHGVVLADG